MKILCCIESFLPGNQGGGPVRALANLVQWLASAHGFNILTRNHDYLDSQPYPDLPVGQWVEREGASILYAQDDKIKKAFLEAVEALQPDWIYLHGALPPLTRMVLQLRRKQVQLSRIPILLAPHGNFGPGSLRHHRLRKRAWLTYAKARGLYHDVVWHAASEREADQIRQLFGSSAQVRIVPMTPASAPYAAQSEECIVKCDESASLNNPLRLVYFGRLSREKNLAFACDLLGRFAQRHPEIPVVYDLFYLGEEDPELQQLAKGLPGTVQVNFIAGLSYDELMDRLGPSPSTGKASYDALLMPSLTENFSYTVLESMQAGIPVLISDQTPWRNLQRDGVGWDLKLNDLNTWLQCLEAVQQTTERDVSARAKCCRVYAETWVDVYRKESGHLFEL
ncbi:glycosyltransferase [Coraliomargarita parva]|uniref:glycosyltransferase n=1 Tax=Coraliomargarita parva TaxID=3014050 RepID=UPI0022B3112B|nr:glycosyltransferase [Coraliomargarita parva]